MCKLPAVSKKGLALYVGGVACILASEERPMYPEGWIFEGPLRRPAQYAALAGLSLIVLSLLRGKKKQAPAS